MPESVTEERKRLCEAYGARIIYTDAFSGSDGALAAGAREGGPASPRSTSTPTSTGTPRTPSPTTAPRARRSGSRRGGRITHFVAGLGTTGTVVGTGRFLHERNPRVQVVAVEPDEPLHGLEGLKHLPSALVPEIWDERAADRRMAVSTEAGLATCAEVMASDGLFVGHSAGAALFAAREVARGLTSGVVVALLCDGGDRYLSAGAPKR